MAWASPITVNKEKNGARTVTELLYSSDQAWQSSSLDVMPKIDSSGLNPYEPQGEQGKQLLGAITQGQFTSYFAGKKSPLLKTDKADDKNAGDDKKDDNKTDPATKDADNVIASVIERSPESARIILFASNEFLNDRVMQLEGAGNGSQYLGGLQLAANTVDWSLEEQGLLSIRSRGHFNRTLPPMNRDQQVFWESANYIIAILLIVALAAWQAYRRRQRARRYYETLSV
jgi:ABC-2 type transport system permease protein